MKCNKNISTHKLRIDKEKVKGFHKTKFCAVLLILLTFAGMLILASAMASSMVSVFITSQGRISPSSTGLTVTAQSGYWQDIQAAVDWIAAHGGIGNVSIPEGTFNFVNVGESWTNARVIIPAGINISGAPTERDANGQVIEWKTVLVMPWEVPTASNEPTWFQVVLDESDTSKTFRFSDIKLVGWRFHDQNSTTQYVGLHVYYAPYEYKEPPTEGMQNIRVDHCCFQDLCGKAMWLGPIESEHNRRPISGVIDHNVLNNTYGDPGYPNYDTRTIDYGIMLRRWACDVWDPNIANVAGKYNNYTIFIEDNYFSKWRHCVCANDGLHYVFRHNIVEGDYGTGSIDTHGSYADDSHPYAVGSRLVEVYDNIFRNPDKTWTNQPWAINHKGGAGLFYNNTLIGYYALCHLNNDYGNIAYQPKCHINQTYIWNNNLGGAVNIGYNYDNTLNVHYFLRAPNMTQDSFNYTPYPYPHPLVL